MTALGIMEDHNRLLHPTDSGSYPETIALRRRGVLAASFVLVALGLLLCVGRESQAKQPAETPVVGGQTGAPQSVGRDPDGVQNSHPAPARTAESGGWKTSLWTPLPHRGLPTRHPPTILRPTVGRPVPRTSTMGRQSRSRCRRAGP